MSEFQNLPLPAIRDAQDYPRVVPAGDSVEIPVIGEFVYCKFSDGDIRVVINGKTTRMESGDERRSGEGTVFRGVELVNDTDTDKAVIFVIGFGKFDRKIIQGEITTVTGVRKADGRFTDDTRQTLQMNITPVYGYGGETIAVGDALDSLQVVSAPSSPYEFSDFGDLKYNNGALYVYVNGTVETRRDLFVIDLGLGSAIRVPTTNNWFADDGNFSKFAFCDELPGGFAVNWTSTNRTNRVRYYDSATDALVEFLAVPYTIEWLEYREDTKELYVGGYDFPDYVVRVYNMSGTVATFNREISLTEKTSDAFGVSPNHCFFNSDTLEWTICENSKGIGNNVLTADENFNGIQVYDIDPAGGSSISGGNTNYNILIGESFYGWGVSDGLFYEAAAVESDLTVRGFASPVQCPVFNIDPAYDSFATRANVSVTNDFGRIKVDGELIRAALELYYRKFLDDGYMDSVYDVTIYNPTDGSVLQSIGGRSITLARLGIADNFSGYFPTRIDITVDSDLPLI